MQAPARLPPRLVASPASRWPSVSPPPPPAPSPPPRWNGGTPWGRLGKKVDEIAADFNVSQDDYVVKPVFKGNYSETMTSAIAAFRAGKGPDIVQIFEVGTATMMSAKGAIVPVYQLMADFAPQEGTAFDPNAYLSAVTGYYTDTDGKMLSMPFNSSTPVTYYNKDVLAEAGVESLPQTWQGNGRCAQEGRRFRRRQLWSDHHLAVLGDARELLGAQRRALRQPGQWLRRH